MDHTPLIVVVIIGVIIIIAIFIVATTSITSIPTTFFVTVSPTSSNLGYIVNNQIRPQLNLKRFSNYVFVVDEGTRNEPFYLTTSNTGGQGAPGNFLNIVPVTNGKISFKPTQTTPSTFFYMSSNTPNYGGTITVS